jgi:hypothetical protein
MRGRGNVPLNFADLAQAVLPLPSAGAALARAERRALESVVEIFLEGTPSDLTPAQAAANVERFLLLGRSRRAWRVRLLLRLIEMSTLPTHGRSFSRLDFGERRAVVRDRWAGGAGVYRLCGKVRNLAILGIYGEPHAVVATGYVPVPLRPRFRASRPVVASGTSAP